MTDTHFQKTYREDYKLNCYEIDRNALVCWELPLMDRVKMIIEVSKKFQSLLEKAVEKQGDGLSHFIYDNLETAVINTLQLKKENDYEYQEEENDGESG